jgi:glycogen debranching enzyme
MQDLGFLYTLGDRSFSLRKAGIPGYERSFVRDTVVTALLAHDSEMLRTMLDFAAYLQGTKANATTGEEPGKIFHEYPGVDLNGKNTQYAACDTTALFLIGCLKLEQWGEDSLFATGLRVHIEQAAEYIVAHLKNGLFWEDPALCGSDSFALKVTYWKDSSLHDRLSGVPQYPVVYTLAHAQNLAGLRAAKLLLGTDHYNKHISDMQAGLHSLFNGEAGQFVIARDSLGDVLGVTSDCLHALYYLQPGDLNEVEIKSLGAAAAVLGTSFGYRTNSPDQCDAINKYHGCSLWPFEQAIIHEGATRFGLTQLAQKTYGVVALCGDKYPELCYLDQSGEQAELAGNDPQLWTFGALQYFENLKKTAV